MLKILGIIQKITGLIVKHIYRTAFTIKIFKIVHFEGHKIHKLKKFEVSNFIKKRRCITTGLDYSFIYIVPCLCMSVFASGKIKQNQQKCFNKLQCNFSLDFMRRKMSLLLAIIQRNFD